MSCAVTPVASAVTSRPAPTPPTTQVHTRLRLGAGAGAAGLGAGWATVGCGGGGLEASGGSILGRVRAAAAWRSFKLRTRVSMAGRSGVVGSSCK